MKRAVQGAAVGMKSRNLSAQVWPEFVCNLGALLGAR